MIKVIFFDAAGTLFHLPNGAASHYRSVAKRHGCEIEEDILREAFGAVWKGMPARPAIRAARADDDRGWWRELVDRVLDRCRITDGQMNRTAYFDELYREFTLPGVWHLYPEVREVLRELRTHYRLGLISNFDGRLRPILGHLQIADFFEPPVISSEVGADKPDPWIFHHALTSARVAPGEACHVGDDPVCDWHGASAAGLHVFRLERPANSLRDLIPRLTALSAS